MSNESITKWTNRISAIAVFLITLGGFILSYRALYELSQKYITGWPAYIWPLLIDLALVVFSVAVLRSYLLRESARWPWLLVGLFTLATMAFNLAHADKELIAIVLFSWSIPLKYLVAIVPPVALVLSFETLTAMLRNNVTRSGLVQSLSELSTKISQKRVELERVQAEKEQDINEMTETKTAELEAMVKAGQVEVDNLAAQIGQRQTELDNLDSQHAARRGQLDEQMDRAKTELLDIGQQIETKRREFRDIGQQPIVIIGDTDPTKLSPSERQKYIAQLVNMDIDQDTILKTFDISAKTLSRDISALNGQVRRQ